MNTTIIKNAYVIDPSLGIEGLTDIEIINGKIAKLGNNLNTTQVQNVYDLKGKMCIPGIIDTHVHLTLNNLNLGYHMLAKSGVTTALDMYGPIEKILDNINEYGSGINVACLSTYVGEDEDIDDNNFDKNFLKEYTKDQVTKGAIGMKLVGGHYPMSPETTSDLIKFANEERIYVAFHVGTSGSGSNIVGFEEAVKLAKGSRLHIAHVNSYCRGQIHNVFDEISIVLDLLKENKNIVSESYLSLYNGTSGKCVDNKPLSRVTSKCLEQNGYEDSLSGLEQAILDKVALVMSKVGNEIIYLENPESALDYYRQVQGEVHVSFSINRHEAAYILATAKNDNGSFVVDSISTDGGEIPRNVIVEKGLQLVKFGGLSMEEFVLKTSFNPAKMLGLNNKGSFKVGNDADVTVIDLDRELPVMAMVMGEVIMHEGLVVGKGGNIITTDAGVEHIMSRKLNPYVIRIEDTLLYCKE